MRARETNKVVGVGGLSVSEPNKTKKTHEGVLDTATQFEKHFN